LEPKEAENLTWSGFVPDRPSSLATGAHERVLWPALDARTRHDPTLSDMPTPRESSAPATPTFRKTLIRVMAVQVGAVVLLWLLQSHYTA